MADPTENTVSIVIAQQYLLCCLLIPCCGNLFTESLPSNERLLWFHYSSFQASFHSMFLFQFSEGLSAELIINYLVLLWWKTV
jgi:hypothetical protein